MTVCAEFLSFCGVRYWPNGTRDKYGIFLSGSGGRRKLITICRHDCAIKCMTATRALMGGILKILILCETLPIYLVDRRLYQSVVVSGFRRL